MAIVPKPDKTTFTSALNNAALLRETGNDPHHLAHTLLYMEERSRLLETIRHAANEYIHFGEDPQLHARLVNALEAFETYEQETEDAPPGFGLDQG